MYRRLTRTLPVALMGLILVFTAACSDSKPETTVETFYRAVESGDFEKAIEQFSMSGVKGDEVYMYKSKLTMIFPKFQNEIEKAGGIDSIKVLSSQISEDGQTAKVHIVINYKDGTSDDAKPSLVKENGEWRLMLD